MLLLEFIIKTGKHFFECGIKARLSNKRQRRGSNGGVLSRYSKILSGYGTCVGGGRHSEE